MIFYSLKRFRVLTVCVLGWHWKCNIELEGPRDHLNRLQLRSVLTAIRWRVQKQQLRNKRFLHMVDSLVSLHILNKGRSSSRQLRSIVQKISALLLLSHSLVILGYVCWKLRKSSWCPQSPREKAQMGKRAIVEGLTQETRKQRRGALGPLKGLIITPSIQNRYRKAAGQFSCISQTQRRTYSPTPWTNGCVSQWVYLRAVGRRPFKKFSWRCYQQHPTSPTILEGATTCLMEVFQGLATGRGSSQGTSPFQYKL